MTELKTKLRKTQYRLKHDWLTFDNVVLAVALVFCLAWTWGSISSMTRNWSLAQELMNRQRKKALLELEVETLELENEYYLSDEYKELAARKYQDKILPGETVIYLPEETVASSANNLEEEDTVENLVAPQAMSNFEQWMTFLFGLRF